MAESNRDEIAKLEALFAANPEGRVFTHLAEAYRKGGELERAREILDRGLQRHADYASGYVVLGRVVRAQGDREAAAEAFGRVLELDPHNLIALRAMGDLARERGDIQTALDHYRELLIVEQGEEELQEIVASLEREAGAPAAGAEGAGAAFVEATAAADAPSEPDEGWRSDAEEGEQALLDLAAAGGGEEDASLDDTSLLADESAGGDFPAFAGPEAPGELGLGGLEVLEPADLGGEEPDALEGLDLGSFDALDTLEPEPPAGLETGFEPLEPEPLDSLEPEPLQGLEPEFEPLEPEPLSSAEPGFDSLEPEPLADAEADFDTLEAEPSGVPEELSFEAPAPAAEELDDDLETDPWEGVGTEPLETGEPEPEPVEPRALADELAPEEPFEGAARGPEPEQPFEAELAPAAPEPESEAEWTWDEDDLIRPAAMEADAWEEPGAAELPAEPLSPSDFVLESDAEVAEDPVVTETIGDLYASQGLFDRAAEVYRELLRQRPGDEGLAAKLARAEAGGTQRAEQGLGGLIPADRETPAAGGSGVARGTELADLIPYDAEESTGGGSAPAAADEEAPWAPERATAESAWAPPAEPGAAPSEDVEDRPLEEIEAAWTGGQGAAAGEPSPYGWPEPPAEESAVDGAGPDVGSYFAELLSWQPSGRTAARPRAEPAPESRQQEVVPLEALGGTVVEDAGREPDEFDRLFGAPEAASEPAPPPSGGAWPAAAAGAGEGGEEDTDLDMFRAWLQSLKQ